MVVGKVCYENLTGHTNVVRVIIQTAEIGRQLWGLLVRDNGGWFWSRPTEVCWNGPFQSKRAAVRSCVFTMTACIGFPAFRFDPTSELTLPEA